MIAQPIAEALNRSNSIFIVNHAQVNSFSLRLNIEDSDGDSTPPGSELLPHL